MPKINFVCSILFTILITSLLLSSCSIHDNSALFIKNNSLYKWHKHQQLLYALNCYQIKGALTFYQQSKKTRVYFNWQQTSHYNYKLVVTNIFGLTELDLNVRHNIARLINNQGKYYISTNPEILITQATGMPLPLSNLQYWIVGLPGNACDFTLNNFGYLKQINYRYNRQKWIVTYFRYNTNKLPALPCDIELRQGVNHIIIKINRWKLK